MQDQLYCCYCKRQLTEAGGKASTALTWDHVKPLSRGGRRTVPCCWKCNNLKGDLDPRLWFVFTRAYPQWWKHFDRNVDVRRAAQQVLRDKRNAGQISSEVHSGA